MAQQYDKVKFSHVSNTMQKVQDTIVYVNNAIDNSTLERPDKITPWNWKTETAGKKIIDNDSTNQGLLSALARIEKAYDAYIVTGCDSHNVSILTGKNLIVKEALNHDYYETHFRGH